MILSKTLQLTLATGFFCAAASAATIFNFDTDSLGTATKFTDTVNGLSATFSSNADPGGFVVYGSMFETLTGNVLGDPGPAGANNLGLTVDFSQNLTAATLNFATSDFGTPSPLTLTAYENSHLVGTNTASGMFLGGFTFPEGEIAFSGGVFNRIVISSAAEDFAVDNINVIASAPAPEPAVSFLLGLGLLTLSFSPIRRRVARKSVTK